MIGGMGMKNKNVLFAVLGIIVLVVLVIGVFYHFRDRRTYTLNLPQLEKLESISLNQNQKDTENDPHFLCNRRKNKITFHNRHTLWHTLSKSHAKQSSGSDCKQTLANLIAALIHVRPRVLPRRHAHTHMCK